MANDEKKATFPVIPSAHWKETDVDADIAH